MKPKKLTAAIVDSYMAVCALSDWSDNTLTAAGLGAGDLWYAMQVHAYIDDYCKRTGLKREEVAIIRGRTSGAVFCQWKYASGTPLPTGP